MKIRFTKMHGLGNDFVLLDCIRMEFPAMCGASGTDMSAISSIAARLCDRRFGIGADQLLILCPSGTADFRMRIFNADGGEVEMCGNGIRCLARYIWEHGLSEKQFLSIETLAGLIKPEKVGDMVKVDMGEPVLEPEKIPVNISLFNPLGAEAFIRHKGVIDYPLQINDREFRITCVSMGNPHAVIFTADVEAEDVQHYGPLIENHALFPRKTNVEFVQVIDRGMVRMRVWERGSGETLACGTGACATAVASNLLGFTGKTVRVQLRGGELLIESSDKRVYMTGPAVNVFEGEIGVL